MRAPPRLPVLATCAAAAALVLWPLATLPWFEQHEGTRYFIRLVALARNLVAQGGHPTWIPELAGGHGYPLFGFYSPGVLTLALPFLPLGPVAAIKAVLFLALTFGAFGLYLLGERLHGPAGGTLTAALGVGAPYAMADLFTRGDVAEYVALCAAPWLLLLAVRTVEEGRRRDHWLLALGYGLFVPLHTVSALLWSGVLVALLLVMALARRQGPRRIAAYGGALALGLALSAWYWLPAMAERGLIHQEVLREGYFDFRRNFLPSPLFGPQSVSEPPMYLGWPLLLGAAVGLAAALRSERRADTLALVALGAVLTWLTTESAAAVWETAPLLSFAQFPWRLLGPASVLLALAAAGAATPIPSRHGRMLPPAALLFVFVMAPDSRLLRPLSVEPSELDLDHLARTRVELLGYGEYAPATMPLDSPPPPGEPLAWLAGEGSADASMDGVRVRVEVQSEGTTLTLSQLHFPGWVVTVDGAVVPHSHDAKGRMVVEVPAGRRVVEARFRDTPIRAAAKWVSLLAVGALAFGVWRTTRAHRPRPIQG